MNRVLIFVGLLGAGCLKPVPCATDLECTQGRCDVDRGFCVTPGGSGGGGAGGGSGSTSCSAGVAASCRQWEECSPDLNGGSCVSSGVVLRWETPDANDVYGPNAMVPLRVAAVRSDGGVFGGPIPYSSSFGASGSLQSGVPQLVAAGAADGPRSAVVGWDGGPNSALSFRVDAVPPLVSLATEPPPARLTGVLNEVDPSGTATDFKKDEIVELIVESTKPVAVAAADFQGVPSGAVTAKVPCTTACASGKSCACFSVDLARIPLAGFRGPVSVALPPRVDAVGNVSAAIAPKVLQVTRWKWKRRVAAAGVPTAVHSPAIDGFGNVLVAVAQTNDTGFVAGLLPSGQPMPAFTPLATLGAMTAAPLISKDNLYVPTKDAADGRIRLLSRLTGLQTAATCGDSAYNFNSSLALTDLAQSPEAVMAVSKNGVLVAVRVGAAPSCVPAGVAATTGKYQVVAGAGAVYLAASTNAPISRYDWAASAWGGSVSNATPLFSQGLVQFGSTVAGAGGPTAGGAYALWSDGGFVDRADHSQFGPASPAGALAVAGTQTAPVFVYGNQEPAVVRVAYTPGDPGSFDGGIRALNPPAAGVSAAPVIGRGGDVFVVDTSGGVVAYDSTLQTRRWFLAAGPTGIGGGQVDSSPSLDVQREAAGGKVCGRGGILYVPSTGDGSLYAFAVDPDGIDVAAPWPKYQHDPANTGNPATPLAGWGCP